MTGEILVPLLKDSPHEWSVGDDAVCIDNKPWQYFNGEQTTDPELGSVYRVNQVSIRFGVQMLGLEGWDESLFTACSFIKAQRRDRTAKTSQGRELEKVR